MQVIRKVSRHWRRKIIMSMWIIHIKNIKQKFKSNNLTLFMVAILIWCRIHNMKQAMQLLMSNLIIANQFNPNKSMVEIRVCLNWQKIIKVIKIIIVIIMLKYIKFKNSNHRVIIAAKNDTMTSDMNSFYCRKFKQSKNCDRYNRFIYYSA